MPGIDSAVLRRRQLDLDKRTADINQYFEKLTRNKMLGMQTEWKVIETRLTAQVKAIYAAMGALQDPKKIKALKQQATRLEAYITQIQNDISINSHYRQQPYFTGVLKHQFEKSYYMNAWGLEQAAKVTATVPVLTPAQVLGALVNPWLPDKANYSDRIRANTSLLAHDMKNIITEAVEEGHDWNLVARRISAKTGEGYFRAVRLARTELTRAQALGATYSYMQNNDILDGKRWNAVLDSRTAPKDAANDGKIYDMDYDTPEIPGVPGQRIPNHPHCRCIWSPVLSALGVSDKERIARGDGDTPHHFGERTYTKARTYRDYAKERGLPDLDDRLANDNLKAYLRPGENLLDLQKEVRRWTYQGKTIIVAEPNWVNPPQVIPPIVKPTTVKKTAPRKKAPPKVTTPKEIQTVKDITAKYYQNGVITDVDRRKHARELLDSFGVHIPEHMQAVPEWGHCGLDHSTFTSGQIKYVEYTLKSNDMRGDKYKVKTAFHELFHATANGLKHDFGTAWKMQDWLDYEETFTECAAHYLARECGITDLHPSYTDKLVRNLPRLKQLNMFKNCKTVDDFGEVMVKYRIIDKKDAVYKTIDNDVKKVAYDRVAYAKQHYIDYVEQNLDDVIDNMLENSPPSVPYRSNIKQDAENVIKSIRTTGTLPSGSNAEYVFNGIVVTAMRRLGVI